MSRINPTLRLVCQICGWKPNEDEEMKVVQQHYLEHHPDEGTVKLDLSAFCTCGSEMRFMFTQGPLGSYYRDNFKCDRCGNEGFVTRNKEK